MIKCVVNRLLPCRPLILIFYFISQVKLTWTLGTKKDVLHINGKPTPIDQWKSTLKSAGMLRENFFFIHQGETNRLAMATPVERIKMLEKFAGADEWEKDKEKVAQDLDECTKSLEEFDIKLEELDGDLDNLYKGNKIHNMHIRFLLCRRNETFRGSLKKRHVHSKFG